MCGSWNLERCWRGFAGRRLPVGFVRWKVLAAACGFRIRRRRYPCWLHLNLQVPVVMLSCGLKPLEWKANGGFPCEQSSYFDTYTGFAMVGGITILVFFFVAAAMLQCDQHHRCVDVNVEILALELEFLPQSKYYFHVSVGVLPSSKSLSGRSYSTN